MSQPKISTLPLPRQWETVKDTTQAVPALPVPVHAESAFIDMRLIVRSLILGALLAGCAYGLGRLLPIAAQSPATGNAFTVQPSRAVCPDRGTGPTHRGWLLKTR